MGARKALLAAGRAFMADWKATRKVSEAAGSASEAAAGLFKGQRI